jgi:hypothetical protein
VYVSSRTGTSTAVASPFPGKVLLGQTQTEPKLPEWRSVMWKRFLWRDIPEPADLLSGSACPLVISADLKWKCLGRFTTTPPRCASPHCASSAVVS